MPMKQIPNQMERKIKNQLKVELKNKGYTYKQIAEKLNITEGTVTNLLSGNTRLTLKRVEQIMVALEMKGEIIIENTTIKFKNN